MSKTNGATMILPNANETSKAPTPTPTPTPTPAPAEISDTEKARRERVVAARKASEARDAAREASNRARQAAIFAANAALNMKGAKVKANKALEAKDETDILAALRDMRESGAEVRVTLTVVQSDDMDGRRYSIRLAPLAPTAE